MHKTDGTMLIAALCLMSMPVVFGDDCAPYVGSDFSLNRPQTCVLSFCAGTCTQRYCGFLPGTQLDQSQFMCILNNLYFVIGCGVIISLLVIGGVIACCCKSLCMCFGLCCQESSQLVPQRKRKQKDGHNAEASKKIGVEVLEDRLLDEEDEMEQSAEDLVSVAESDVESSGFPDSVEVALLDRLLEEGLLELLEPTAPIEEKPPDGIARVTSSVAVTNVVSHQPLLQLPYSTPTTGYMPVANQSMYAGPPPYPGAQNMAFEETP